MATAARRRAVDALAHLVLARRERIQNAAVTAPRHDGDQPSQTPRGGATGEGDLSAA